jgi:hypothetical protein
LIAARATEIEDELTRSFDFSVTQRFAVNEVARLAATLEAIDSDIAERGVVDKRGEPRSVLNLRSRYARQLNHCLTKIAPVIVRLQFGLNTWLAVTRGVFSGVIRVSSAHRSTL